MSACLYVSTSRNKKTCYEHRDVAERALGKKLPPGSEIHHVDENKKNNAPENLVICPSRAYHALLHARTKALDACGHADWLSCYYCKQYDDPKNMQIVTRSNKAGRGYVAEARHGKCHTSYNKRWEI